MTDEVGMGRAYWSRDPGPWGPYDGEGRPGPLVPVYARPYPRAIGGVPRQIAYDRAAHALTVRFDADGSGPTEIYLPADEFPRGGRVTGALSSSWDPDRRILTATTAASGVQTLTVTPS